MTRKISVDALRPGMYIEALDRPWLDTDFLYQGFFVDGAEDIAALRRQVDYVYISEEAASPPVRPRPASGTTTEMADGDRHRPQSFFEEIEQVRIIRSDMRDLISDVHRDIRAGRRLDLDTAQRMVTRIADSAVRNQNALLWFSSLKARDDYTAQHSMHVCMLAVAFAAHLALDDRRIAALGLGALLHDIGKLRVPLAILNKPGRLTEAEMMEIRRHPQHGIDILSDQPDMDPISLDVVLNHHERLDGSGYPRGIDGDEISQYSRILAICDVYDALTSDRVYHRGRTPADAIAIMRDEAALLDTALLEAFIAFLGDYPVGTLVELNTGEVGLIVPRAPQGDTTGPTDRPVILIVLDHNKHLYYPQRLRDLTDFARFDIERVLPSGAFHIDIGDYAVQLAGHAH